MTTNITPREQDLMRQLAEAKAELAALKAQEPVYEVSMPSHGHPRIEQLRGAVAPVGRYKLYLAAGAQPIPEVTPAQLFDIYCEDKGAGDFHRPEHNYYAGFRRAMTIVKGEAS